MRTRKRFILVACLFLIAALTVCFIVFWKLWPKETEQFVRNAWAWINAPLPVVGFSGLMIFLFVWKLIAVSSYGKRAVNQVKEDFKRTREEVAKFKKETLQIVLQLEERLSIEESKNKELSQTVQEICAVSRNAKVKAIAKKLEDHKDGERKKQA